MALDATGLPCDRLTLGDTSGAKRPGSESPQYRSLFDLSLVALLKLFRDEAHAGAYSRADRSAFASTRNCADQRSAAGASTDELHIAVRTLFG